MPYGTGTDLLIPVARLALSLTPKRLKSWLDSKKKIRDEKIEAKIIIQTIESNKIEQAIIVYDYLVSPPTYGDYFMVVMLARYFITRNIHVNFLIVDGEYRSDWHPLSGTEKQHYIFCCVEIAQLVLDSSKSKVEVLTYKELESRIKNYRHCQRLIPFKNRAIGRIPIHESAFNVLNHLMSVAGEEFRNTFLLSFDEFVGKVKFESPALPYITWHCRYSEKWGKNRNTDDNEFLQICDKLKSNYPEHAIMVVSDEIGCKHFRELAHSHGLECIFSKEYSPTFMGDGALVLGSDFYYQYSGGGMGVFALFSTIPYELHVTMVHEIAWHKFSATSWASEQQTWVNIPWGKAY